MVKVICSESGIEFEAKTSRTKQHPDVADMKNRAYKNGNYSEVTGAMAQVRKSGGYETVEQYIQMVREAIASKNEAIKNREIRANEEKARREEEKKQFAAWKVTNGYTEVTTSEQVAYDNPNATDFIDEYLYRTEYTTTITAPDGQTISSMDCWSIFQGKTTLVDLRASQQAKIVEAEVKQQADIRKEKEHEASITQFATVYARIKATATKVKDFHFPRDAEIIIKVTRGKSDFRSRDEIQKTQINGIDTWRVVRGTGYDDDGIWEYWCTDPIKAELSPLTPAPKTADEWDYSRLDDIFG